MSKKIPSFAKRYHDVLYHATMWLHLPKVNTCIDSSNPELIDIVQESINVERKRLIKEIFKYRVPGPSFEVPVDKIIQVTLPNCKFNINVHHSEMSKIHLGAMPINTSIMILDNNFNIEKSFLSCGNPSFIGI